MQKEANYLCKLLESNESQPHGFQEIQINLPSKKCTEAKENYNACDLNDCNVRDKMLEGLEADSMCLSLSEQ
jgi:hypothetical protein